jgi:hypothetical protein
MGFTVRTLVAAALAVVASSFGLASPPPAVPLPKALEQTDFVGIVSVTEVPPARAEGYRASDPPVVVVRPVAALKGGPAALRVVWQTFDPVCLPRDPKTVEVVPPAVGDEFMVFLTRGKDGTYNRLGYEWHFHRMPAAPTVRTQPGDAWRGLMEVTPPVAGPGEAVRYRFTRTRLAAEPWVGEDSNLTAEDLVVVDFTRKQVLAPKKPGVRSRGPTTVSKGQTVVDVIDLTDAFAIAKPGEYWVFKGGAFEGNAPLRFEVTDQLRVRTDGSGGRR